MVTTEEIYRIFQQHRNIQTDTRQIKKGDIFFALKGPHFNGNDFAIQAIDAGASYAVIDENPAGTVSDRLLFVTDVLQSLQSLAGYHRDHFTVPFIAITGSNGKTTTKELVHAVLSSKFKTATTEGNLNNHIGIPLTLLKVKDDAEMVVIEMGANHQKEIESYCVYTRPTHGMITNAGKAHLEGFGGEEGVRKGKGELYDFLKRNKGTAFVMWDYDYLQQMSAGIEHIVKYGTDNADITGRVSQSRPWLEVEITKGIGVASVATKLVGDYNLPNVLAAIAIGSYFKVPDEKIKTAIENYTPSNSRSQLMEAGSNKIILDAYNANPSSMKAAIENFSKIDSGQKILMLGGMAELGEESIDEHKKIVDLIQQFPWKEVVLVGGDFLNVPHPYIRFENAGQAKDWLQSKNFQNSYMLIKGSRSMQMEKVLD